MPSTYYVAQQNVKNPFDEEQCPRLQLLGAGHGLPEAAQEQRLVMGPDSSPDAAHTHRERRWRRPPWTYRGRILAMGELRTNKEVEDAAIAWVLTKEQAEGRLAKDVRYAGAPYDIDSPPRAIEVKAVGGSNRGFGLWLEVSQIEEALRNPNFFVYVVENIRQGDSSNFTLRVLGGERLGRLLERAKERRYYEVPWPVADYDSDV